MDYFVSANVEFSVFSRRYLDYKKELPIRPSEMGVLHIISNSSEPHTSVMIAERMGVSKPMITAHLRVLLKKGYVVKQPVPEDGRAFYVLPTEKAHQLLECSQKMMERQLENMRQELGEEDFSALVRLVGRANKIMIETQKTDLEND